MGCSLKGSSNPRFRHGLAGSPEHRSWTSAIGRCYNKTNPAYPRYGGRGIRMCLRWRESFLAFLGDMGPKPSPSHSIDRINNDGNYEPSNCRWATKSEQARNRKDSYVRGDEHYARVRPEVLARGSRVGTSKLTEKIVANIKRELAAGKNQSETARRFRISVSTVHLIAKGVTWRHVC